MPLRQQTTDGLTRGFPPTTAEIASVCLAVRAAKAAVHQVASENGI